MTIWKLYVESTTDDDVALIEIDSNCTFLEFRKKAADAFGLNWKDLLLCIKKDYNYEYNSQTLEQMHDQDRFVIKSGATFFAVVSVNGGTFIY